MRELHGTPWKDQSYTVMAQLTVINGHITPMTQVLYIIT